MELRPRGHRQTRPSGNPQRLGSADHRATLRRYSGRLQQGRASLGRLTCGFFKIPVVTLYLCRVTRYSYNVVVTDEAIRPLEYRVGLDGYARTLAEELRPSRHASQTLLELVSQRFRWVELRLEPLAAKFGRQDALTCPKADRGFVIVIDPDLSPRDAAEGRSPRQVLDWRLAHELGHTYFFSGSPARRWVRWSPDEEHQADSFASVLLRVLDTP